LYTDFIKLSGDDETGRRLVDKNLIVSLTSAFSRALLLATMREIVINSVGNATKGRAQAQVSWVLSVAHKLRMNNQRNQLPSTNSAPTNG
jgi:hypothetical protein